MLTRNISVELGLVNRTIEKVKDFVMIEEKKSVDEIDYVIVEAKYNGMCDCAPLEEVSRQLWALLNPFVNGTKVADDFANIPRLSAM